MDYPATPGPLVKNSCPGKELLAVITDADPNVPYTVYIRATRDKDYFAFMSSVDVEAISKRGWHYLQIYYAVASLINISTRLCILHTGRSALLNWYPLYYVFRVQYISMSARVDVVELNAATVISSCVNSWIRNKLRSVCTYKMQAYTRLSQHRISWYCQIYSP